MIDMTKYTVHINWPEPDTHLDDGPPHMVFNLEGSFSSRAHAEAMADHIRDCTWLLPTRLRPSVFVKQDISDEPMVSPLVHWR